MTSFTTPPRDRARDDPSRGFIHVVRRLADCAQGEDVAVGDIVDQLDERAFGVLVLLLAIPCLVPGLPGAQIIALPIFLLALQIAIGRREPWLPGWFLKARVKRAWLQGMADFSEKRLLWIEKVSRPRLTGVAAGPAQSVLAVVMALASATIMLPITNTIPSAAVTLMAIGLIQRDGLFALCGAALASVWIAALTALTIGLVYGAGAARSLVDQHLPFIADLLRP